jgi:nucleoside-diphosphate-sugar epimerase
VNGQAHSRAEMLAGRRVLVTGGTGFIGSRLSSRLSSLGAEVYAISRAAHAAEDANVRWLAADLAELEAVRSALAAARPDVVMHLASHVAGGRGAELVPQTFRDNLASTVNLLTAAEDYGCTRVVLAGSMEEPGMHDPAGVPSSPYAAAKWAAAAYARMFHALYSLPVVMLRIFMVSGPGQRDSSKLVPYVILSLLNGESPRLTSGTREVDWVYVDDVVDAFLRAALARNVEGTTSDIGSGSTITIHELVARIVSTMKADTEPIFGALPDRPLETSYVADVARTEEILGWRPTTGLDQGLRTTIDWYAGEVGVELGNASA